MDVDGQNEEGRSEQLTDEEPLINSANADTRLSCHPGIRKPKRLVVIEPVLILQFGITFPAFLLINLYIYSRIKEDVAREMGLSVGNLSEVYCTAVNTSADFYIAQEKAQSRNAMFNIISSVCIAVPCFISTLFLSGYSDKAGRKYALVLPLSFMLAAGSLQTVAMATKMPLWVFFVANFIVGIGGNYQMTLAGCFAYLADTVEPQNRMFRIAVIELLSFMVGSLGPIGVGNLVNRIGYVYLMLACVVGYFITVLYVIFAVPETIIRTESVKFFTLDHLKASVKVFTVDTEKRGRRWKLDFLFVVFFIIGIATLGGFDILTLFELNSPLCWSSAKIGDYSAVGMALGTVLGITLAKLLKCCLADENITLFAGTSGIIRCVYQGFVANSLMMYFVIPIGTGERLFIPTIRALMSNLVLPTEQGAMFGAIAVAEVWCSLIGSVSFDAIYAQTLYISSGFVFFVVGGVFLLGTLLMVIYVWRLRRERRGEVPLQAAAQ